MYEYVESLHRYRNRETGQFVSRAEVMAYVDRIESAGADALDLYAELLEDGTLSAADYGELLRDELKSSYIQQGILGRGGRDQMTQSDWGRIGAMLKPEYQRITAFVVEIDAGALTIAQITARSRNYFKASRNAYEQMNAAAYGIRLPAYPCDGTSECMNGCRCSWDIRPLGDGDMDCYWEIDPLAENCATCADRGFEWYPLAYRDGDFLPYRDIRA